MGKPRGDTALEAKLKAEVKRRVAALIKAKDYRLLKASDVYTCGAEAAEALFETDRHDGKLHFKHHAETDFVPLFLAEFHIQLVKELHSLVLHQTIREWHEKEKAGDG